MGNELSVSNLLDDRYPIGMSEVLSQSSEARKSLLISHLEQFSIRRGDFVLKSGKKSSWFIDSKMTACHPQGMLLVASLMIELLSDEINAIGGLTMGADPVSFTVGAIANTIGRNLFTYSVRKETKDHGAGGRIAGMLPIGATCAITEDTVTRGNSMFEAYKVTEANGAKVKIALAIVDRGGTVEEMMAQNSVHFIPLVTAPELGFGYESGI